MKGDGHRTSVEEPTTQRANTGKGDAYSRSRTRDIFNSRDNRPLHFTRQLSRDEHSVANSERQELYEKFAALKNRDFSVFSKLEERSINNQPTEPLEFQKKLEQFKNLRR